MKTDKDKRREVERLLERYEKQFGDMFPSMHFVIRDDEHWIRLILACLDAGKTARELYRFAEDGEDAQY